MLIINWLSQVRKARYDEYFLCHTLLLFHKSLGNKELQEGAQSTKTIKKAFKKLLPKEQPVKFEINFNKTRIYAKPRRHNTKKNTEPLTTITLAKVL